MEERYRQLKMIAERHTEGASPAHDITHVMKVYNLCLELAKYEPNIDLDILRTARCSMISQELTKTKMFKRLP
jgi:HD superfamily phosphodiesterase